MKPKTYVCKHHVEALLFTGSAVNRDAIATWLDEHDQAFELRGFVFLLDDFEVCVGDYIVFSHGEFIVIDEEQFENEYAEVV